MTDKPPARKDFLEAMARAPGIIVPEKTYCRILTTSKVHCASQFSTQVYLKVRITTGPYRGSEGWGCEGSDIQYANGPSDTDSDRSAIPAPPVETRLVKSRLQPVH